MGREMEEPREDAQTPDAEQTPEVAPAPEAPAEAAAAPQQPQPDPTAPQEPATEAPAAEAPGVDAVEASSQPAGDVPAMETAAVADAPADAGADAATDAPAEEGGPKQPSLSKIKKLQQSHAHRPRRGGGGGQKAAGEGEQPGGEGGGDRPKKQRRPKNRPPRPPREKGPLPFNELRDAARAIMRQHGEQAALKVAVAELAPKERNDISDLVKGDGDFRVRARSISAGSLAAGKLGKALAAQQIAVADVKDLWPLFLSKEEAAERQAWIRNAKRRDEQRAKRQEERRNRQDRISKEDMEKARDGRVGAQIRFVIQGEDDKKRDRKKKDEPKKKTTAADLLDRLGY